MVKTIRWIPVTTFILAVGLLVSCEKAPTPTEPVTGTVASADGIPVAYEATGKGDVALVFVHCWTCNSTFWDEQVKHFAKEHRVVRLDLAGHGKSGKGRSAYTMGAFGSDVAAVVNELGLNKVVLIGHSMGGPVSLEAAKRLGDRVVGIVGVDTFYTEFEYPKGEKIAEFVAPFKENFTEATGDLVRSMFPPHADQVLVQHIQGIIASANQDMAISAMTEIFTWNESEAEALLREFAGKLRNINADSKGENKPSHESVVLIQGVGHFLAQEKPDEFNLALEAIVADFQK